MATKDDAPSDAPSTRQQQREDRREFRHHDARLASMALGAGVHPAHVDRALDHYAKALSGLTPDEVNDRSDDEHRSAFASIARDNPEVRQPPPEPAPTRAAKPKTFAPGKSNSMSESEARQAMRAKGINYKF